MECVIYSIFTHIKRNIHNINIRKVKNNDFRKSKKEYIFVNPIEIGREVLTAYILEATIPKPNCASLFKDKGTKSCEHFVGAAVASAKYFEELARRINEAQGQPKNFYDLAYNAMVESENMTGRKPVNYGLLDSMFPLVVSRYAYGKKGHDALANVPIVLSMTSFEDAKMALAMRKERTLKSHKTYKHNYPFKDLKKHQTKCI